MNILQDMLGILNDCPKHNFKFYLVLLLKQDSGLPEIKEEGIELSDQEGHQRLCSNLKEDERRIFVPNIWFEEKDEISRSGGWFCK